MGLDHMSNIVRCYRKGITISFLGLPIPRYWKDWQDVASFLLTLLLIAMLCNEPILYCLHHSDENFDGNGIFTENCPQADSNRFGYSVLSMTTMVVYYMLLADFTVFSMRISTFFGMCGRVLSEVGLFLFALSFMLLLASSAISAASEALTDEETSEGFKSIH